jgi:hypothetical protein
MVCEVLGILSVAAIAEGGLIIALPCKLLRPSKRDWSLAASHADVNKTQMDGREEERETKREQISSRNPGGAHR